MENPEIISNIIWERIPIKISYKPKYSEIDFKQMVVSHIQVRAGERLPITETGYRSIFFFQQEQEIIPCVKAQIIEMLNEKAASKEWKQYKSKKDQLLLF